MSRSLHGRRAAAEGRGRAPLSGDLEELGVARARQATATVARLAAKRAHYRSVLHHVYDGDLCAQLIPRAVAETRRKPCMRSWPSRAPQCPQIELLLPR